MASGSSITAGAARATSADGVSRSKLRTKGFDTRGAIQREHVFDRDIEEARQRGKHLGGRTL